MNRYTQKEFEEHFMIYKSLSDRNGMSTAVAMCDDDNGGFFTVVLKEMNEKRAFIYEELSEMYNPYIAQVYDVIEVSDDSDPEDRKIIVITEYVTAENSPDQECISLAAFVRKRSKLEKKVALSITTQICEGLREFHKKGFVHRDLKPENIMISYYDESDPRIKIIDFDGAKIVDQSKIADTTVIGTLGYQAPESLSGITTKQSDIYSLGCILNYMLTGQEPGLIQYMEDHNIVRIIEKATNKDPNFRYYTVTNLKKEIDHELRIRPTDKIPVLRLIPGLRTLTPWKVVLSFMVYITYIFIMLVYWSKGEYLDILEGSMVLLVFPLILICNLGNVLRFVPPRIRKDNVAFLTLRIIGCILLAFGDVFYLIAKEHFKF